MEITVKRCTDCPFYFYMERGMYRGGDSLLMCQHPKHESFDGGRFGETDDTCECPLSREPLTIRREDNQ